MSASISKHSCNKIIDVSPPLKSAGNAVGFTIEAGDGYGGGMIYRFFDFPPAIAEAFYQAMLEISEMDGWE